MTTTITNTEAELRHAVIDRLIAASLRDVVPAREASLKNWRTLGGQGAANGKTDQTRV